MASDPIVSFYSGGVDDRGRRLDEILGWSDERLESVHDYIQWVFPTTTASGVNPHAPLVTSATVVEFAAPGMRDRLRRALDRMLRFYGLTRSTDDAGRMVIGIDSDRFRSRSEDWLTPGNHNHLRLTRIMQSLAALGLEREARALQRCLLRDVAEGPGRARVTADTLRYWGDALG